MTDFILKYATKLSYASVKDLVSDVCGNTKVSSQQIWRLVNNHGLAISAIQATEIDAFNASGEEISLKKVDIYALNDTEVLYLCDDVCVKEQKVQRDKIAKKGKSFCNTRISMLQKTDGTYESIVAGLDIDIIAYNKSVLWKNYGKKQLPIVAISDGATSLKNDLKSIFGEEVVHILDWFHLNKKVHQTLTMISHKEDKLVHSTDLLNYLWQGKSREAIEYLKQIKAKNESSKEMLITYLSKNENTIIDYKKRQENGKIIGSGRTEKANDTLVAKRQKYNGMAWTKRGSLAITLTTANINL
ncbi:MAG: hypothetical protein EAZ38_19510 [Cytophagales bacterium]|nr:MAG: hypothetical protein EAZ38_19510 [Cytophagales bacterium]